MSKPAAYCARTTLRVDRLALDRPQRLEHLELLVADDVGVERVRRLHRDQRQQLQQVVLHHVAQRAGLLVVAGARADAFLFGDGDLHVVDVFLVEQRLEDAVGEPQHQDVLDRLLAEVVVDAVDLPLVEDLRDRVVDGARAVQIAADRLLDDQPRERLVAVPAGATNRARASCFTVGANSDGGTAR